jgi:hypothetical protein
LIVVEKRVLMKVVLPSPDSPATWDIYEYYLSAMDSQPTMIVKAAPLFATILCRWLGRLAIPIGDALSAAGGDIVGMVMGQSDDQDSRERWIWSRTIELQWI